MGKYDLSIDDVLRHYDEGGKNCPKYYVEHEEAWTQLKQDIADYIAENGTYKAPADRAEEMRYFLHGTLEDLHDPYLLKGMREGSAFLYAAIREKKQIRIIGDYDVDGICSTYVLYHALQLLGASVSYRIPHRIKDGYGLNEEIIRECSGQQTIMKCLTGK